ncbi:hypothetical protein ACFC4S_23770 [Priestia megaterium]|uniref:hypothetical protein n=1 Tax=Priestia megaterium TaxID=1404 RepID=UPI0035E35CCF
MFKRFIPTLLLMAFLIPQQHVSAEENNIYYNKDYQYTITFPSDWYIFSTEMEQSLSPDVRENSPAMFTKEDGSSQMYIRHLSSNNNKFELYTNLINYVEKTPKEKQKLNKVLDPISIELGRTIKNYNIDELNETVELQMSQTSSAFGEIHTTIFWKEFKGTLIELEFYHFENNEELFKQATTINNSFTISPSALSSNIKEGKMDFLNNKLLSNVGKNDTFFTQVVDVVEKPAVWMSGLGVIFLLIILRIIYKLI